MTGRYDQAEEDDRGPTRRQYAWDGGVIVGRNRMGGYFTAMSRCTRSAFRTSAVVCGPVPGLCNRGTCPVSEEDVPNPAREIEKPAGADRPSSSDACGRRRCVGALAERSQH